MSWTCSPIVGITKEKCCPIYCLTDSYSRRGQNLAVQRSASRKVAVKLSRLSSKNHGSAGSHAGATRMQVTVVLFTQPSVLVWRLGSQEHAISGCKSLLLIGEGGGPEAQMLVIVDRQAEADRQGKQATSSSDPGRPCSTTSRLPCYWYQEKCFCGATRMPVAVNNSNTIGKGRIPTLVRRHLQEEAMTKSHLSNLSFGIQITGADFKSRVD